MTRQPVIYPYGVLYGRRACLMAHIEGGDEMRISYLDCIGDVSALDENFAARELDLASFAAESLGVLQQAPQHVVLRVSDSAADDAKECVFHSSQTIERQDDGSLIVRSSCGGILERSWHLFTWRPQSKNLRAGCRRQRWNESHIKNIRSDAAFGNGLRYRRGKGLNAGRFHVKFMPCRGIIHFI
jgi:hypothetical protein